MPIPVNPPREGHPGKPPKRRQRDEQKPIRDAKDEPVSQDVPTEDQSPHDRVTHERETVEDLANEPMREDD